MTAEPVARAYLHWTGVPLDAVPVGAYRRTALYIDGVRRLDTSDVVWLQTPTWFVDVRQRLEPGVPDRVLPLPDWCDMEYAFAGTTSLDGTELIWAHQLSTVEITHTDRAVVERRGSVLEERGRTKVLGREVEFIEHWLPLTAPDCEWNVDADSDGIRVEVGAYASEVVRTATGTIARRYELGPDGWQQVGVGVGVPPADGTARPRS